METMGLQKYRNHQAIRELKVQSMIFSLQEQLGSLSNAEESEDQEAPLKLQVDSISKSFHETITGMLT